MSNSTGVNSKFYGIRVAKKLVYYSFSPYISLWGPSLQFRVFLEITSLSLPTRGSGGYCSPSLPHGSLLSQYLLPLKVLSCVIVTIRGFVFLCSYATVFHYFCCCSSFLNFSVKWSFFVFLRNVHLTIEIFKIELFRISLPSFTALFRC